MTWFAAWLVFMGVVFLANAWVPTSVGKRRSRLNRYRPVAWLEEVGDYGVRTHARLQRVALYRVGLSVAGAVLVGAGAIVLVIHPN